MSGVYELAERCLRSGDAERLRALYSEGGPAVRQAVLNALWGEPASPEMGEGLVALAVEAAADPDPGVRTEACSVMQNQCAWGVDVSAAVAPLRALLDDPEAGVRRMAAFAVGNVSRQKEHDLRPHLVRLGEIAAEEDLYASEAAAWALGKLSRAKRDIAPAVPALAGVMASREEWNGPRKNAAGALLHHARKSPAGAARVRSAVEQAEPDPGRKEVARFLEQLRAL